MRCSPASAKEQLAVYHGQESVTPLCAGQGGTEVYMYPTEYLTYGSGSTANVISAPGKAKEYWIADHLGSVRVALGVTTSFYDYEPFGKPLAIMPERLEFIGKEMDRRAASGASGCGCTEGTKMIRRF